MTYFLLEFDRRIGVSTWSEWTDSEAALAELAARERNRQPEVEVVLLLADSIDQLKRTHSRYFMTAREIAEDLRASFKLPA